MSLPFSIVFFNRYENDLQVMDQWPKLQLGFNDQTEIQILNGLYYISASYKT